MKNDYMLEKFGHLLNSHKSMAEWLTLQVTETLCEIMEEANMSRKELADKMGVKKSYVSQLLSGNRNMTLRTLAKVAFYCGRAIRVSTVPVEKAYSFEAESRNPYFSIEVHEPIHTICNASEFAVELSMANRASKRFCLQPQLPAEFTVGEENEENEKEPDAAIA